LKLDHGNTVGRDLTLAVAHPDGKSMSAEIDQIAADTLTRLQDQRRRALRLSYGRGEDAGAKSGEHRTSEHGLLPMLSRLAPSRSTVQ